MKNIVSPYRVDIPAIVEQQRRVDKIVYERAREHAKQHYHEVIKEYASNIKEAEELILMLYAEGDIS